MNNRLSRKGPRWLGKDERCPVKLKAGEILSNNPDARSNGFDARNGDVIIKDAEGNVKKVVKNQAQFKQGRSDWSTVKRARK